MEIDGHTENQTAKQADKTVREKTKKQTDRQSDSDREKKNKNRTDDQIHKETAGQTSIKNKKIENSSSPCVLESASASIMLCFNLPHNSTSESN